MATTITISRERHLPWLQDPVEAHRQWRSTLTWKRGAEADSANAPTFTPATNRVYQAFWAGFCRWCALPTQALKLDQVRSAHIEAFLQQLGGRNDAPASVRTMRTSLAEINRVYTHLEATGVVRVNPAAVVLERIRGRRETRFDTDPPLPPSGVSFLQAYRAAAAEMFEEEQAQMPGAWTPARNLALRLVVSECGLKLSEVCKLIPRNVTINDDGTVTIRSPGHRQVLARTVTGPAVLGQALANWIALRGTLRIVQLRRNDEGEGRRSNRLFLGQADNMRASQVVGGGLGSACSPVAPDLAERVVSGCVKRALAQLGHEAPFHGPQVVRNAFAARLIQQGFNDAMVSHQLGMKTSFTARAIREKLQAAG
ncbi:site-specific integrase [Variovorax gossypii]